MSIKSLQARSSQALSALSQKPPADPAAQTERPMSSPGAQALMQPTINALNERTKSAEAEVLRLKEQLAKTFPTEADISLLVEVPGRRRKLSPEEYRDLTENLRNNPLISPVTVKALADGRFEIISGNNRTGIYRDELGRTTIPISVLEIEDALVEHAAFIANLLQPSLPDYEKFLGFKSEQARTGKTQRELAQSVGLKEAAVSMIFAFDELPAAALALISKKPRAVGMSCAAELARLAKTGATDRVVEAVRQIVEEDLSQKEAVAYAARTAAKPRSSPALVTPVKIKAGRSEFCQYVARGNSLRIEFRAEVDRQVAQEKIAQLLEELADSAKRAQAKG